MQEYFLESRGIAYRANAYQPGRPTLVFIHGFSSSSSGWAPYEKKFEDIYNLIIPDLYGHGFSQRSSKRSRYTMESYADDIHALLGDLGVEKCIVVGYSLGAMVVIALAHKHPDEIAAAILISPLYYLNKLWRVQLTQPLLAFVAFFAPLLPATHLRKRVNYTHLRHLGDESPRRMWADLSYTGLKSYFLSLYKIYTFAHDSWWKKLLVPTVVLYGKHDTVLSESQVMALAQDIPHAQLVEFKNGNHMLPYNNIPEVEKAIEEFVSNLY